jgi:predicted nucleotidyltransferase
MRAGGHTWYKRQILERHQGGEESSVFSVRDRERIRDHVLEMASSDTRVVAGAIVGSLARDEGDRWSDLDLTFAVADGVSVADVLEDWTHRLTEDLGAVQLFDLPSGGAIYRVFLLPGCLQFDLSFSPPSEFGAIGPNFRMLFGTAVRKPFARPPSAHELFGYAVHHAVRARFCIERGRYWEGEYWVSGVRDSALSLACRRRDLPARHGRGFDRLPADVRDAFTGALVHTLDREGLLRALGSAIEGLLREGDEARELAARVEPQLRRLTIAWGQ